MQQQNAITAAAYTNAQILWSMNHKLLYQMKCEKQILFRMGQGSGYRLPPHLLQYS